MKVVSIAVMCLLAGCATSRPVEITPTTTFTYFHGEVRAIDLLLRISECARLSDGAWKVRAHGSIEGKDFYCVVSIPGKWSDLDQEYYAGGKHADIHFSDSGSGTILDELVQRHHGKVPSVFSEGGFGVSAQKSAEKIDREPLEFGGFANAERASSDASFQCLAYVDVPGGYMKLAFLVEGYGGHPPKEVYQWLRSWANQRPDGTPVKSPPSNPGQVSGVPHP